MKRVLGSSGENVGGSKAEERKSEERKAEGGYIRKVGLGENVFCIWY